MSDHRITIGGVPLAHNPSHYPIGVIYDKPSHALDEYAIGTTEGDKALALGYTIEYDKGDVYLWLNAICEPNRGWHRAFDPVTEEYLLVNPAIVGI